MDSNEHLSPPTMSSTALESESRKIIVYDRSIILGRGGFAIVYSGKLDGKPVAVKRMQQEMVPNDTRREEEALRLLDHPNVIRMLHVKNDEDFRYYALELCKASLNQYFFLDDDPAKYKGSIPSDKEAFIQLAEGLNYIHSMGLVHRDVKPDNVLISVDPKTGSVALKWSDFGLCRPVNERGTYTASEVKGTMDWFAPEILKMIEEDKYSSSGNVKRGTIKSDTFAAGAVFFYILSGGNHPFGMGVSIPSNIRDGKPTNLKALNGAMNVSWFAKNIVLRMLDYDFDRRISLIDVIEGLKSIDYTMTAKFNELQIVCFTRYLNPSSKDMRYVMQMDRVNRLIDQEAYLGMPANENLSNILDVICSMEKLKESKRELVIESLIEQGAKISYTFSLLSLITRLSQSISENHLIKITTVLLDAGIDFERHFGENELFLQLYCCSYFNNEILTSITKVLRNRGFSLISSNSDNGVNVLHHMCQYGRLFNFVDRIRLLLTKFDLPVNAINHSGSNAFHLICSRQYYGYSYPPMEEKEQVEIICNAILYLAQNGLSVNDQDHQGRTLLFCLYETGGLTSSPPETELFITKITRVLIDIGLNVNATDKDGANVLHKVCSEYQQSDLAERIRILIDHGVKIDALDGKGWNALHCLCSRNENIIKKKLDAFIKAGVLLRENGIDYWDGSDVNEPKSLSKDSLFLYSLFMKLEHPSTSYALEKLTLDISRNLGEM